MRDPDLTTLKVTADPPSVEPGKPVGVVVSARTADYQAAQDAQVRVELFSVATQKPVAVQTGTTGPDGVVRLEFPPPAPGPYKLLGTAKKGETDLGKGEDAVAVRAVGPELSDASVRPELMEQIAKVTGGKAYRLPMERAAGRAAAGPAGGGGGPGEGPAAVGPLVLPGGAGRAAGHRVVRPPPLRLRVGWSSLSLWERAGVRDCPTTPQAMRPPASPAGSVL